ncbi:hypothetical protein [Salinisphaera orenii]|uniref:hypothetical protein n=1 Tax=Salinisphaera orenii TaxID=856731 RepID=UPI0011CD84E0|nr:hypothetical protein [Salinisphaera halophila]
MNRVARSTLDAQLKRSKPRKAKLSRDEAARQKAHHRALIVEWRKDPEWAAAEAQLEDERYYLTAAGFGEVAGDVSGSTIHRWRRNGKVIGVRGAGSRFRYPRAQLNDADRLPEGLPSLIAILGNSYFSWLWLTSRHPGLDGVAPIDALKSEGSKRVLDVARADHNGAFW